MFENYLCHFISGFIYLFVCSIVTSTGGENGNTKSKKSPVPAGEVNGGSDEVMVGNTGATKALELRNPPDANANATQPSAMIPNEAWLQVQSTSASFVSSFSLMHHMYVLRAY